MAGIADDFRARSKANAEASETLMKANDFGPSKPIPFASAIIGQVNATIYLALADMMDFTRLSTGLDATSQRRMKILEINNAIRVAAAKGDWDGFDKLSAGLGTIDEPATDPHASPAVQ